ncbi:MAG: septum formation initiator family protein [Bdellovibrionales bacterium]|nr:septum formation initiator family protein [Bdellovibrionales bacterium]
MNSLATMAFGIILALLAFFIVAGQSGLMRLGEMRREVQELDLKNRELESEIVRTQNKIYGLRKSDPVLEKLAREELGLSKPGEIVYIFPDASETQASLDATMSSDLPREIGSARDLDRTTR